MTKIDIFSGFLGAGKTTLIKKLIAEAYNGEKLVLIENEFGDVGIDGGFLQDAGIEITEMNSGCICCSLVGDFGKALTQVLEQYSPDRIIIEPSGVGKLSDVMNAVAKIEREDVKINGLTTIVDAKKCKMYSKNFGEFFNNQIGSAKVVILSHTAGLSDEKLSQTVELIKNTNSSASVITTDWDKLMGKDILEVIEGSSAIEDDIKEMISEQQSCPVCGHHHDHEEECGHHHDHDGECDHHHHDHDGECGHHHHHHADDVFASWGVETITKYNEQEIRSILDALQDSEKYGIILRSKGMVESKSGEWIYFDYVPGEPDIRSGKPCTTGRLCVIGSKINEDALKELFKA